MPTERKVTTFKKSGFFWGKLNFQSRRPYRRAKEIAKPNTEIVLVREIWLCRQDVYFLSECFMEKSIKFYALHCSILPFVSLSAI